jgi:hypothetical protein
VCVCENCLSNLTDCCTQGNRDGPSEVCSSTEGNSDESSEACLLTPLCIPWLN